MRTLPDKVHWSLLGACRDENPELFFPTGTRGGPAAAQAEEAKAVCRRCPVFDDCAIWVKEHPKETEYGVWAATTEQERTVVRQQAITPTRKNPQPRPVGRNNPDSPTDLDEVDWLLAGGVSIDEAARKYRIGVDTLMRYMEFRAAEQRKAVA